MMFTKVMMFLIPVVVARHHHRTLLKTILKANDNLYAKLNDDVQNVINNLFDSLNIDSNFLSNTRIKLLLTMHYDLKSIAEKNFEVHHKMKDSAKPEHKNMNKIELFELIQELFDDIHFSQVFKSKEQKHIHEQKKLKTSTPATPTFKSANESEFADTEEFMEFIQDFVKKVDNLTVQDFYKPSSHAHKQAPNAETEEVVSNENLKVWRPPPVLDLDYVNDTTSRRIFMGRKSKIKSYPFVASIHMMGVFSCAGSIITEDLIITAASCLQILYNNRFYRENPKTVAVRIGSDYFIRGGEKIDVIETYFHPNYDPKTLANNLVILRLDKVINFFTTQERVRRIRYDRIDAHLPINTAEILIVGWGSKKRNQVVDQFEKLMVARLDVYPFEDCVDIYSKLYVTNKNFCAGFLSTGSGACNKDLGGPGVANGILVGVVSFGAPVCGAANSPTVFTKLGHYADWIDSIVKMQHIVIGQPTTLVTPILPTLIYNMGRISELVQPITEKIKPSDLRANQIPGTDDILVIKSVLNELAKANASFLRDVLYGDTDVDIFEMFRTTQQFNVFEHPLVNKSILPLDGMHITPTTETTAWNPFYETGKPKFTIYPNDPKFPSTAHPDSLRAGSPADKDTSYDESVETNTVKSATTYTSTKVARTNDDYYDSEFALNSEEYSKERDYMKDRLMV